MSSLELEEKQQEHTWDLNRGEASVSQPHRETAKRTKEEMLLRKPEELSHWRGIRHAPSKAPEVYCELNLRKNSFPTKYVSNCVLWTASIQGVGVRWGKEGKDSK